MAQICNFEELEAPKYKRIPLDISEYIDRFVEEFMTYFPGIYQKEVLRDIIARNVSKISLIKEFPYGGEYNPNTKEIILKNHTFDATTFHEFIHVLRNEYRNKNYEHITRKGIEEEVPELDKNIVSGIEEGFTTYIELLYRIRKSNKKNVEDDFFKADKEERVRTYLRLALMAEQYTFLSLMLNGNLKNRLLYIKFLNGDNIRTEIYKLYKKYYQNIDKQHEHTETDVKRAAFYDLVLLDDIYTSDNPEIKAFQLEEIHSRMFYSFFHEKLDKACSLDDDIFEDVFGSLQERKKFLGAIFRENYGIFDRFLVYIDIFHADSTKYKETTYEDELDRVSTITMEIETEEKSFKYNKK